MIHYVERMKRKIKEKKHTDDKDPIENEIQRPEEEVEEKNDRIEWNKNATHRQTTKCRVMEWTYTHTRKKLNHLIYSFCASMELISFLLSAVSLSCCSRLLIRQWIFFVTCFHKAMPYMQNYGTPKHAYEWRRERNKQTNKKYSSLHIYLNKMAALTYTRSSSSNVEISN